MDSGGIAPRRPRDQARVPRDQWPATCAVTADYEEISTRGGKSEKGPCPRRLEEMNNCHQHPQPHERISGLAEKTREFVANAKAENPRSRHWPRSSTASLGDLRQNLRKQKAGRTKPAAAHFLIDKVIALIDSTEENKDEKANDSSATRDSIGGNQDSCIGEFPDVDEAAGARGPAPDLSTAPLF